MKKKKEVALTEHQQELENEINKQMSEIYANKDKKVKSTKNVRKLFSFYSKYKALFISFIVIMILFIVVSFFEPMISAQIVEDLTTGNFDRVLRYSLYYLCGGLIFALMHYSMARIRVKLNYNVRFDLRQNLMNSIDKLSMKKVDNLNSGLLISRMESDCDRCGNVTLQIIERLLRLIRSLCFFIYIAFINIWLFIVLCVYVIAKYFIDAYRFGLWRKNSKISRRRFENAHNIYFEQIKGIRDVKSLNLRENMSKVSEEKVQYTYRMDEKINVKMQRSYYFMSFPLDYIMEVALLIAGLFLIKANIIVFASFMVVYLYKDRALSLANFITEVKDAITEGELSAERYFDIVDRYEKEKFGTVEKNIEVGEIELKDIKFEYEENSPVLKGVNLKIEPNKTTAIIGKSGSGKSTMLSLIGKMYDATGGEILIDGSNLNDLTEDSLRNAIGIVNQSPYLFNASIKNNMKYVKPDATEEEIWNALDKAEIGEFVRGLENGLDSMIGENGVKVSGGQKQRLAIARVLLKGNKVLVFDEATSALDNNSQAKIVEELDNLKEDHTIIVVAHRLSTIVNADKIVVLDNGQILAEGKHKELMKSCELYKNLYLEEEKQKQVVIND